MTEELYSLVVADKNGSSIEYTDYTKEEAEQECIRIGTEGYITTDPNGNGWMYFPPHRVVFVNVKKMKED